MIYYSEFYMGPYLTVYDRETCKIIKERIYFFIASKVFNSMMLVPVEFYKSIELSHLRNLSVRW